MATTQISPKVADGPKPISVEKEVFDIDSKGSVTLKKIGEFTPVSTAKEFTERLQGNADLILKIMNDGLEKYTQSQLESDSTIAWKLVEKDDAGVETLSDFTGTTISEKASEQVEATIMNFARLYFNYEKNMVEGDVVKNRAAKKEARKLAEDMFWSNPAGVERLRGK